MKANGRSRSFYEAKLAKFSSMTPEPVAARSAVMPTKVLSLLTGLVVAAHLLVLAGTTQSLQPPKLEARGEVRSLSTRSITPAPAQAAAQPPAAITAIAPVAKVARSIAPAAPRAKPAQTPRSGAINTDITTIGPHDPGATAAPSASQGAPGEPAAPPFEIVASEASGASPATLPALAPASASTVDTKVAEAAAPPASASSAAAQSAMATPSPSAAPASVQGANATAGAKAINTALTVPGSTRLKYNVIATKGSLSFNARAELLWLQDGSNYDARLEVSAFLLGARIQTSTGRLTAEGLEPKRFADKFRSEVAAHFERDKRLVTFSANTPQVPIVAGMQDQLSVVMQLSAMIAGAPEQFPSGTAIAFNTIGPRSGESWVLTVGDEEKLALPGGEVTALKLTRKPRGEYDQTLELWLAPQLAYLPARIKLTEKNGDYADQVWRATETP